MEPLSEYNAEYGAALLMNLSLLPQGKKAAEKMLRRGGDGGAEAGAAGGGGGGGGAADENRESGAPPPPQQEEEEDILEVVSLLLQSPNQQVRTYANGTLYSLLQRETIRESARSLGFEELLADLAAHSDPVFVRQLTHIIALLASSGPGTAAAAEPAGGAPDDDAAAPFPGYSQFDPEPFNDVEDAAGGSELQLLQEEEPAAPLEEGEGEAGAGAGAGTGEKAAAGENGGEDDDGLRGLLATTRTTTSSRLGLFGEELLRADYLVDDEVDEMAGTVDGTGFGRETIGPDDDAADFLPKEEDEEEPAAAAAAGAAAAGDAPTPAVKEENDAASAAAAAPPPGDDD